MQILHVVPGISPRLGGPTEAVLEMCRALNREGVGTLIATTDTVTRKGAAAQVGRPRSMKGVTVHCFNASLLAKYGYSRPLVHWLKQNACRVDAVHFHGVFSYLTWPTARVARKSRVPYLVRPAGQLNPWSMKQNRIVKRLYLRLIGRRCLEEAAALHVTSEGERLAVSELGFNTEILMIPHGVSCAEGRRAPARGTFRSRHGIGEDTKLVAFLSRLHPVKGLDQLLPAVRAVSETRRDFALVIAGSGTKRYERRLQALVKSFGIKDRVLFTGFLEGEEKWNLLGDADIFVLPSYTENFGFAAVEAMEMGLPLVVSENVGIQQDIRDAGAGLVTRCDRKEIAVGLSRLLDDGELRIQMGENGRRLVRERFEWKRIAKKLIAAYQRILARPRS